VRRQRPLATGRRTTRTRSGDAVQNYSGRTPCSKNDIVEGTAAGTGREGGQAETAYHSRTSSKTGENRRWSKHRSHNSCTESRDVKVSRSQTGLGLGLGCLDSLLNITGGEQPSMVQSAVGPRPQICDGGRLVGANTVRRRLAWATY